MLKTKYSISVFFPCYNDEKSIGKLVKDVFEILRKVSSDHEVIVVDDDSHDESRKILNKLTKKYNKLKLVFHDRNMGYGGSLRSGFKNASKDIIFYTDGDGQYDVKELPNLLTLLTSDTDFVNGIKMVRHDPTYRIFLGNLYSFLVRWIFWLPTYDVDCDFRLVRASIINKFNLTMNSGAVCVELVKKAQRAGASFRQVSIHHYERRYGHSQFFKPERILITLWELGYLWLKLMILDKMTN